MIRGGKLARVLLAALALSLVTSAAGAHEHEQMCEGGRGPDQGKESTLCPTGPAGCVAIGVHVEVEPNAALPFGATAELSRSSARADAGAGYAIGHGDAALAKADIPGTLGAGVVDSRCDVYSSGGFNYAAGEAGVERLSLNLATAYGLPVYLNADTLRESGWSASPGIGGNDANITALSGSVFGIPLPTIAMSAPANTTVPLGPAGTLVLNEQTTAVDPWTGCLIHAGSALRLSVRNPATGALVATVTIGWVATTAC